MPFLRLPRLRFGCLSALLLGLAAIVLGLIRCSGGESLDTLMAEYGPPVPVSEAAAQRLVTKVARAVETGASTRRVELTITEREATSALALGAEISEALQVLPTMTPEEVARARERGTLRDILTGEPPPDRQRGLMARIRSALRPRIGLREPQVRFLDNGQIVVAGYLRAWRWRLPALLIVAPRAQHGELELDFVKGRLGRVPAPEWVFDRVGTMLSSLILMGQDYAEITTLRVGEGRLLFAGVVKGG